MMKPQPITLNAEEAKRYTQLSKAHKLTYELSPTHELFFRVSRPLYSLFGEATRGFRDSIDLVVNRETVEGDVIKPPDARKNTTWERKLLIALRDAIPGAIMLSMVVMGVGAPLVMANIVSFAAIAIGTLMGVRRQSAWEDKQAPRYELAKQVRAETLMERGHFKERSPQISAGREQEVSRELKSDWVQTHGQKQQGARVRQ